MSNSMVAFIQHLKIADEYLKDYIRANPESLGEKIFSDYSRRINFILKDMLTNTKFPDIVRDGLRKEINSDVLAIPEIENKISLLSPEKRELIESVLDAMLSGEEIIVTDIKEHQKETA